MPAPDGTQIQLEVLAELASVFASLKIGFWLRGGWALDFLLGRITRVHSDIDLVSWARERTRIQRGLLAHEFVHVNDFPAQSNFQNAGRRSASCLSLEPGRASSRQQFPSGAGAVAP